MTGPVDISNLGIDASKHYALNAKEFDNQMLLDMHAVRGKLEVSVLSPARALDTKFEVGYTIIWASFDRPQDFSAAFSNLFTHLLVPSLGGPDVLSDKLDQINAAPKPEPALKKLLEELSNGEKLYLEIYGRLKQFAKG